MKKLVLPRITVNHTQKICITFTGFHRYNRNALWQYGKGKLFISIVDSFVFQPVDGFLFLPFEIAKGKCRIDVENLQGESVRRIKRDARQKKNLDSVFQRFL